MKSQRSRIRWNSLFAMLSQLIRLLTNFLLFVWIARFYGPEAFGQFTTAHTLATIFILFADFGFDTLLATEVARHREGAALLTRRFFSFKLVFALLALLTMFGMSWFQHLSEPTKLLIRIFSFYVFFSVINTFFFALFKGFEQLYHETRISFLMNLVLLLFLGIVAYLHLPVFLIALLFVGSRVIGILLSLSVVVGNLKLHVFKLTFHDWQSALKQVMIYGFQHIFGTLFFTLDTILISFWRGDHEVGIYQSVVKLAFLAMLLLDISTSTMLPVLARLYEENPDQWKRIGYLLNKSLFLISLPIASMFYIFSEQLVTIIYGGSTFAEAIPIMRIFSFIVFFRFGVEASALMLTSSFQQRKRLVIVVMGTVLNYGLNIFMIPRYGIWGAAIISLVTNVTVGLGYVFTAGLFPKRWFIDARCTVPFVIMGCLAILLWQIKSIPFWYTGPLAIIVYAIVFYYVGYTSDERRLIFALGSSS